MANVYEEGIPPIARNPEKAEELRRLLRKYPVPELTLSELCSLYLFNERQ